MYSIKCGKEIKETTGFCPYCGEKILNSNSINSNSVKGYNDFNRDMGIAVFAGICILIRMMIGIGFLIVWTHWTQISYAIGSLI